MKSLVTLGHGTADSDELAALLRIASIESVVDVRTVPKSRRHPHAAREAMEIWIPQKAGATYRWEPRLGGFRKPRPESPNVALRHPSFRGYADYMETETFATALNELLDDATDRTAVMCSETLWWRCHRRLIADAATLLHGFTVKHLMHDGKLQPHVPTAGVRVLPTGVLRYDVLFTPES